MPRALQRVFNGTATRQIALTTGANYASQSTWRRRCSVPKISSNNINIPSLYSGSTIRTRGQRQFQNTTSSPHDESTASTKETEPFWTLRMYRYLNRDTRLREIMTRWNAAGPPPISEYRLTFGKHRGKKLTEVPDTYLVKYLLPRKTGVGYDCPLVVNAINDFLERHPEVKSQAGPKKTEKLKDGILQTIPKRNRKKKEERP